MSAIKASMGGLILTMGLGMLPINSNAQINLFTDHQVVYMVQHGVNMNQDVRFPTGDYPYLGRLGIEYERDKFTYSFSYIHRSNVDIQGGDEYNYNGVSLGVKYTHCIYRCN